MSVWVCVCEGRYLQSQEKGRFPGAGVKGSYELPSVCFENLTQVLYVLLTTEPHIIIVVNYYYF